MRFFFFQTNLVFKSKPAYIDILDSFCHSLCTFLFLIIDILRILMFIQCLYAFFIKTSKILIRFNIFLRFSTSKCSYYVLFSMKHSYLLTAKISPDVNNSLHVRSNFWCLIMASTKLR